ncbi:MAG: hypothetical protein CVU72_07255 [Deltaproteobacteria bacterium HGW-Deltaproteobacteria-7]|nr:MAG: hypothetical protein CVU72_07255 [Deltaproteobacteria bacterium HGW-Deltaproteobacteria-7]
MTHLIWPSSIPDPSALTLIWASVSGTCFTHAIIFTLSNLLLLRVIPSGENTHLIFLSFVLQKSPIPFFREPDFNFTACF